MKYYIINDFLMIHRVFSSSAAVITIGAFHQTHKQLPIGSYTTLYSLCGI